MLVLAMVAALQAGGASVAALGRPPRLRNGERIVTWEDFPPEAARRGEYGIVSVRLGISVQGRVISCDVTETSRSKTLDARTCSLAMARARFDPALDAAGLPVAATYRLASVWGIDAHQPKTVIDLALQVASAPPDYRTPLRARLAFDATGHIAECEIVETSGSDAVDRTVCAHARRQLAIPPPESGSADIPAVAMRYLTASLVAAPSLAR